MQSDNVHIKLIIIPPMRRAKKKKKINLRRDNHEFLESQTATSVGAALIISMWSDLLLPKEKEEKKKERGQQWLYLPSIKHVQEGDGQDVGLFGTGEIGDVGVERDALNEQPLVLLHFFFFHRKEKEKKGTDAIQT